MELSTNESTNEFSWNDFPDVVKREFLDILPIELKRVGRLVCKEWKHLIEMPHSPLVSFRVELSDSNLVWVNNFGNERRIDKLFVTELSDLMATTSSRRCLLPRNVDALQFLIPYGVSQMNAVKLLLLYSPSIKCLETTTSSIGHVKSPTTFCRIQMTNLQKLIVVFNTRGHYTPGLALFQIKYPSLSELVIEVRPLWTNYRHKIYLYKNICEFLSRTIHTLKKLKIVHPRLYSLNKNFPTLPFMKEKARLRILKTFSLGKLEELQLKLPQSEGIGYFNLGLVLIQSQRHLRILHITNLMLNQFTLLNDTLSNCSSTLTELKLEKCMNPFGPVDENSNQPQHIVEFNWSWMTNCNKLKIFEFTLNCETCIITFMNSSAIPLSLEELILPGNVGQEFTKDIIPKMRKLRKFGFQYEYPKVTLEQILSMITHSRLNEISMLVGFYESRKILQFLANEKRITFSYRGTQLVDRRLVLKITSASIKDVTASYANYINLQSRVILQQQIGQTYSN